MACIVSNTFCMGYGIVMDCEDTLIHKNITNKIIFTLIDKNFAAVDLNLVDNMVVNLYDTNKDVVARYSYGYEELPYIENILYGFEELTFLQFGIENTFDENSEVYQKGEISFLITKEISSLLLSGSIYVAINFKINNLTNIINKFKIGTLINNTF